MVDVFNPQMHKHKIRSYYSSVSFAELLQCATFLNSCYRDHIRYGRPYLLILPGEDEELEEETLRLLPAAKKRWQVDFFLILGLEERRTWIEERASALSIFIPCDQQMLDILCRLHAVYPYGFNAHRLAVCSMAKAFDSNLYDLVGKTKVTREVIARHAILWVGDYLGITDAGGNPDATSGCSLSEQDGEGAIDETERKGFQDPAQWPASQVAVVEEPFIDREAYFEACADRILKNPSVTKKDRLVLFGVMATTFEIRKRLANQGYTIVGYVDNDEKKAGSEAEGVPVCRPEDAERVFGKDIRFIVTSKYYREMCEQLMGLGYRLGEEILVAYAVFRRMEDVVQIDELKEMLHRGEAVYRKLRSSYPTQTLLHLPYSGTGDAYLAGMYLSQYCGEQGITDPLLLITAKSCIGVLSMFGLEGVLIDPEDSKCLIKYVRTIGFDAANYRILNDCIEQINVANIRGRADLDFHTMFRLCVFRTDNEIRTPVFKNLRSADFLLEEYGLREGRTVLLSPYAVTMPSPSNEVWEEIAERLMEAGFDVCTNIGSSAEQPIRGTKGIHIPFDQLVDFVRRAGFFVGTRSGLCDIISSVDAEKIVLYPDRLASMSNIIGRPYTYFSLKKMRLADERTEEFVFEEGKDRWLVEAVVGKILEGLTIRKQSS